MKELVIKIPEEEYRNICLMSKDGIGMALYDWIANGIPLSKGHGKLKDADVLKTAFPCGEYVRTECVRATIDYATTIIEADKAESEE